MAADSGAMTILSHGIPQNYRLHLSTFSDVTICMNISNHPKMKKMYYLIMRTVIIVILYTADIHNFLLYTQGTKDICHYFIRHCGVHGGFHEY